jgi:hypothetical protein
MTKCEICGKREDNLVKCYICGRKVCGSCRYPIGNGDVICEYCMHGKKKEAKL